MIEQILSNMWYIRPEIALTITCLAAILADVFFKRKALVAGVVLGGLLASGVLLMEQYGVSAPAFSHMLAVDPFSVYFRGVILVTAMFVVLFSLSSVEINNPRLRVGEYYALIVAMTLGMTLMAGSSNMLMMYLSLELTSLSSYILAGFTKNAPASAEASLKYVIFGALSSGLMLYGISILYGLTGSLDIYAINHVLMTMGANRLALLIAGVLIMAGFGYKISAVPFHFWTPDVYEGAPVTITAFLSVASKAAGFSMLMRFMKVTFIDSTFAGPVGTWALIPGFEFTNILIVLSVLTMTLGNLVAVWQKNVKRLLAYSSIAHAGYMLMGLVVLGNDGFAAVLIYFVIYMFMNLGAFFVVMLVSNKTGSEHIDTYKGLGSRAPLLSVAMAIFLVSLTGLPPTAGFIGKLYLFAALINAKMIWLAIVGALNSVVSLYYYVLIFRNMFLREGTGSTEPLKFALSDNIILFLLLIPTLVLGLYFTPLVQFAQYSVAMFGVR
ncbi:MAG: NADH-quinone oxidoreductase subunit N [Ignavibacteriales bacterium]|nr:NADH-quinone oxidoreductase subunit N [Ignavibacteriales bacterium]